MQISAKEPLSPRRGIKRTVGYMDDEDDDSGVPTAKMTRLTVNEAAVVGEDPQNRMRT